MHTTVFISLVAEEKHITKDISIPRKYPFSPFSVGERACPAMAIVLPVIKHIALHVAKFSPNVLSKTLFKIVDKRNAELLEKYAKMDINLNAQDKFGDTILHHAVKNNDVESVRILVKYGADVVIKNRSGYSPMGLAKYLNRKNCLEALTTLEQQKSSTKSFLPR